MHHYIYILYSKIRNHYYIDRGADLQERLNRHNAGATLSTKNGRPWKIVYHETYADKSAALKREIYLKRMKSRILIEELIRKNMQGSSAG